MFSLTNELADRVFQVREIQMMLSHDADIAAFIRRKEPRSILQ